MMGDIQRVLTKSWVLDTAIEQKIPRNEMFANLKVKLVTTINIRPIDTHICPRDIK